MSAEQTKSRILEAAFRDFAEHGMAGARVDRIATSAACNKNLIYVYFGSKEALFATVLDRTCPRPTPDCPSPPRTCPAMPAACSTTPRPTPASTGCWPGRHSNAPLPCRQRAR